MAEYIERESVMQKFADHVNRSNNSDFVQVPTWNQAVQIVEDFPAADVRPVVHCRDCYWWTKQEASIQGRCSCLGMYPTGNWYCANGQKRREKS